MKGLPDSKIYEQELQFWPYVSSWNKVLSLISKNSPINGKLLDVMCGPGYLAGKIAQKRKDLRLSGIDIDKRYVSYAQKKYPKIKFENGNILTWKPKTLYDVVICTGSLHHIAYELQERVVQKISSMVKPDGFVIISDCCIDDYENEIQRKVAAAKLGYEYLKETIQNGAPQPVIKSTVEILWNDVLKKEFKTSLKKREDILKGTFNAVKTLKTWPNFKSEYGDYIFICKNSKKN